MSAGETFGIYEGAVGYEVRSRSVEAAFQADCEYCSADDSEENQVGGFTVVCDEHTADARSED